MSMLPFDAHRRLFSAADEFRAPAVFTNWAMAASQAAAAAAHVAPADSKLAQLLAEEVLRLDMVTQRGLWAKELARQVLRGNKPADKGGVW